MLDHGPSAGLFRLFATFKHYFYFFEDSNISKSKNSLDADCQCCPGLANANIGMKNGKL
jgi:hypothetical protein